MKQRPREVPVAKPSAVQSYVPNVLLRSQDRRSLRKWLPNERKPGASKHFALNQKQDIMRIKVDTKDYCTDFELDKLQALEEEVFILESTMEKFIEDFYLAAAVFTTQATAQKSLFNRLKRVQTSSCDAKTDT